MLKPSPEQLTRLKRWRLSTTLVMIFGYIGYYLCRGNLSAALPLLSSTFSYSNTDLAIIMTVSELAYALGKFLNGPLADKIGGRIIFLSGMVGAIVFNVLFTAFSSIFAFTVVWSLCRYFLAMGWGGLVKIIGSWYEPKKNGTIMGIVSVNFLLGGGIAFLYCSAILSFGFGWKELFLIPAATLGVIAVISFFAFRESPQDILPGVAFGPTAVDDSQQHQVSSEAHDQPLRDVVKSLLQSSLFRWLLIFNFFTTLLRSMFTFWTAKFFADLGLATTSAILKAAVFPFLGILGAVSLGWYTDKYSKDGNRMPAICVMLAGLVASLLGIAFLTPYGLSYQNHIVILTGACGFFLIGPYTMISGCLTLDIAGASRAGSCTGILDGAGYIGGALAVWGAGLVADQLGWSEVFFLLAFAGILAWLSAIQLQLLYVRRSDVWQSSPLSLSAERPVGGKSSEMS